MILRICCWATTDATFHVDSSGLRKKVTVFQQPHYSEAFVTSILLSIPEGVEGEERRRTTAPALALTQACRLLPRYRW